jgi:hypothetical protein
MRSNILALAYLSCCAMACANPAHARFPFLWTVHPTSLGITAQG